MGTAALVGYLFAIVALGVALHAELRLYQLRSAVRESLEATHRALTGLHDISQLHTGQIESVYHELHELWCTLADEEDLDDTDDEPPLEN